MLTSDEYTESHGRECPVCGSYSLWKEFSEAEDHGDFIEVECGCYKCDSIWSVSYAVHGYELIRDRMKEVDIDAES